MDQNEFLNKLSSNLILLDEDIVEDIIKLYEKKIASSLLYEKKTLEDVFAELGEPEELAKKIYEAYNVKPEKWESAREIKSEKSKKIKTVLVDLLIAPIIVPVLLLITLSGFGAFVNLPIVVRSVFNFAFPDSILMLAFMIGAYTVLAVLLALFIELAIVIVREIVVMNIKAFTPENQTTARLVRKISLLRYFKSINLGKTTFITVTVVGVSFIAAAFLLINTYRPDLLTSFGEPPIKTDKFHSVINYDAEDLYDIFIDLGNVEVSLVTSDNNYISVIHSYNAADGFVYNIDEEKKVISFTSDRNVDNTILTPYKSSLLITIPKDMRVNNLTMRTTGEYVYLSSLTTNNADLTLIDSNLSLFDVNTNNLNVNSEDTMVVITSSFLKNTLIENDNGYIILNKVNNLVKVGDQLKIINVNGNIYLDEPFYQDIVVSSSESDVYYSFNSDLYTPNKLEIVTDGEVFSNSEHIETTRR